MCVHKNDIINLKSKWGKRPIRRFWKCVRVSQDKVSGLHRIFFLYQSGENTSDYEQIERLYERGYDDFQKRTREQIYYRRPYGIHVFYTKKRTKYEADLFSSNGNCIVVPVWAHKDDLIIANNEQAAFTKVAIRPSDWQKRVIHQQQLIRKKDNSAESMK